MTDLCKCSLQLLGLFEQLLPRAFQVAWVQVFAGQSCCGLFHLKQTEGHRRVENASGEANLEANFGGRRSGVRSDDELGPIGQGTG